MRLLLIYLLYVLGLANLVIASFVLLRGKDSNQNRAFFGLSVGIAAWSFGIAGFIISSSFIGALLWAKIYYIAPVVMVFSVIAFADYFIIKSRLPVYVNKIIAALGTVLILLIALDKDFLTTQIVAREYGKQVVLNPVHYAVYSAYVLAGFITAIILMYAKYRSTQLSLQRRQLLAFLIGFTSSCVLGVFFNLVLPWFGDYSLIEFGPICTAFLVASIGYSMVKHHLFGIRVFMIRAGIYSATTVLLALLYVAPIIWVITRYFNQRLDLAEFVLLNVVGTLVATNYSKLQRWFNRVTSRFFFRDSYEPSKLLADLNKTLVSTIDLGVMLNRTSRLLTQTIRPEFCYFVLNATHASTARIIGLEDNKTYPVDIDRLLGEVRRLRGALNVTSQMTETNSNTRDYLHKNDIGVIVSIVVREDSGENVLGYLVVGERKSGKEYDLQDVQTFSTVANTLVIAMQNALRYEEVQNFNKTLQERVEVATKKLKAANARLIKLDETKDEFVSMASHQLRTPLTSVKGYLSMVIEGDAGPLNAQQEDLLKQSYMSSQRMVNLIADLLNLSRLSTGKFVIDSTPTDLRVIVDQEVAGLRETAKAKHIELTWDMPKTFSLLPLDENKIHQVVMNFVDNALYYTPEDGKVEVTLIETPKAVEFRVKDTGIGVPRELQRHLFTKFYRADNARRMRPDGTGLGLYMAKKVVVAQGGSVIFESQEGKGSVFGFRFRKPPVAPVNVEVA
ncbi:hypothetical protein JNM87_04335 [Candidatus Saccharibacteria bacterium]|nr:hypothetical protein [Candidatus Saccharibacteria bacterium]